MQLLGIKHWINVFGIQAENIHFLDEGGEDDIESNKTIVAIDLGVPEHNLFNMESDIVKKFDFVVGNPPYDSLKALHQKFFVYFLLLSHHF